MDDGGRIYQPVLPLHTRVREDGRIELASPGVGLWRGGPRSGAMVVPGDVVGELEVLGILHALRAPAEARGMVVERRTAGGRARVPVGHGDVLLVLDPGAAGEVAVASAERETRRSSDGDALMFAAPSSGRFYCRPAPDKPPFVSAGDEIAEGQTVCLLEVMKTFNRIAYRPEPGSGLPSPGRVRAIVPADGDDIESGDPILELEPLGDT